MIWGNRLKITHSNRHQSHSHDMHELVVCFSDLGEHTVDGETHEFKRGRTFLLPGGVTHRVIPDAEAPAEILFVCFDQQALVDYTTPSVRRNVMALVEGGHYVSGINEDIFTANISLATLLNNQLHQVGQMSQEQGGSLLCALLINHWRCFQFRDSQDESAEEGRINVICQDIVADPQAPVSIGMAAARAGMSRATFTRKFRATTGMSLVEYARSVRVKTAMRLLSETTLDIDEIAFRSGFDNLGYFYRVFRQHTQRTPRQFRLTLQSIGEPVPILKLMLQGESE